ncbi:MAG: tetratricopeptide repeat protein [candidate division Zixibacteria bacterium]|nr:tetratricopeptide repeat protein [candidate division Zixibacteria bacterium]MDH3936159.1 tetratricopeptide repeat protein [candidate division Zixibacteria bacterium]MDH4032989.1 tetratricopeptide repeat protein [candidate division Zixibacteria bacterium]
MTENSAALENQLAALTTDGRELEPTEESVKLLLRIVEQTSVNNPDRGLELSEKAYHLAEQISYQRGLAGALTGIAFTHYLHSDHAAALPKIHEGLHLARQDGDPMTIARALTISAGVQLSVGNYEQALANGFESLKLYRQIGRPAQEAWALHGIGTGFLELGDFDQALEYARQSLAIFENLGDDRIAISGRGRAINAIGMVYKSKGDLAEAACYFRKSLEIFENHKNNIGIARSLNDLGEIHQELGEFEVALDCHTRSLEIRRRIGMRQAQSTSLINLGKLKLQQGEVTAALELLTEALRIALDVNVKLRIYQAHRALSDAYEAAGSFEEALKHQRAFQQVRDEVSGDDANTRVKNLQVSYEIEKSENEAEIERLKNVELKEKNEQLKQLLQQIQTAQAHLVQAEKMAALGKLVAGILHEMNSPLGSMKSAIDVLRRSLERLSQLDLENLLQDTDMFEQFRLVMRTLSDNHTIAHSAGDRLASIVHNLKSFARLDEATYQTVDLHDGLESALAVLNHELDGRISVVRQYDNIPKLTCYASEMNQVFLNLLTNAMQSMDGEGTITVTTSSNDNSLSIEIRDTGAGIAEDQLSHLFEPNFTQTGPRAKAGLGLFASHNIVSKHGGEIRAESTVGRGSRFTISLPFEHQS